MIETLLAVIVAHKMCYETDSVRPNLIKVGPPSLTSLKRMRAELRKEHDALNTATMPFEYAVEKYPETKQGIVDVFIRFRHKYSRKHLFATEEGDLSYMEEEFTGKQLLFLQWSVDSDFGGFVNLVPHKLVAAVPAEHDPVGTFFADLLEPFLGSGVTNVGERSNNMLSIVLHSRVGTTIYYDIETLRLTYTIDSMFAYTEDYQIVDIYELIQQLVNRATRLHEERKPKRP